MKNRIITFIFVCIIAFLNILPVSAIQLNTNELSKNIEFITIRGKDYKFTQYIIGDTNYLIREDDTNIDVFNYDKSKNIVTKNGEAFGVVRSTFLTNLRNFSLQASVPVCNYPKLTNVYDEQSYLAVYETCTSYQIAVGTGMEDAIAGISVFTMITGSKIKSGLISFLGGKVLPAILDSVLSTERQQFRSRNLISNPYSGLRQYKRLFVSYYFTGGNKFYGPEKSIWWF